MNIEEFILIATTAPSADNSQPWEFFIGEKTLSIRYKHRSRRNDTFGAFGHGTLISAGALHETIDTALRIGGVQTINTINYKSEDSWVIEVPIDSIQLANSKADFSPLTARHTNRHPYGKLDNDLINLTEIYSLSHAIKLTHRIEIIQLASCFQYCTEARFNNQELHEWLFSSIRWNDQEAMEGIGLDISTLHLPLGGQQIMHFLAPWARMKFLNRFGLFKIMAYAETEMLRKAPAIIAIVGKPSEDGIWSAGRHLQKIWIDLNRRGIAVHPYYAITDLANRLKNGKVDTKWEGVVSKAQQLTKELLKLGPDEELHMLLRIGTPTVIPVVSRRMPFASFINKH